jgi:hypothetical protein
VTGRVIVLKYLNDWLGGSSGGRGCGGGGSGAGCFGVEVAVAVNSNIKNIANKTIRYMYYSSANYCAILLKTAVQL